MKISFYDTFIVQNFKNSHFCPNNYKDIVPKMRVKITLFSAISILFLRKSMKNLNFDHISIRELYQKIGAKIDHYDTFA